MSHTYTILSKYMAFPVADNPEQEIWLIVEDGTPVLQCRGYSLAEHIVECLQHKKEIDPQKDPDNTIRRINARKP